MLTRKENVNNRNVTSRPYEIKVGERVRKHELKPNKYLQAEEICNYTSINAIESPSFDVINGTTRVSDPL